MELPNPIVSSLSPGFEEIKRLYRSIDLELGMSIQDDY